LDIALEARLLDRLLAVLAREGFRPVPKPDRFRTGYPPRRKDFRDVRALCRHLASTRPRSTGAPPPDPAATVPGQAHVVAMRRARGCAHGGAARAVEPWRAERLPHERAQPSRSRAVPRGQARVVAIRRARGCAHGGAARAVEPWRA